MSGARFFPSDCGAAGVSGGFSDTAIPSTNPLPHSRAWLIFHRSIFLPVKWEASSAAALIDAKCFPFTNTCLLVPLILFSSWGYKIFVHYDDACVGKETERYGKDRTISYSSVTSK
jgi:hypothetical protein